MLNRRSGFHVALLQTIAFFGSAFAVAAEQPLDSILRWQSLGPDIGGRVTTVAGVPQKPFRFYAGTVGGGIIRTDNAGQTWELISSKTFGSASVGALAVAPSDPRVIYAGMGESTQRTYMSTFGDGLYRSDDGGETWLNLGLKDTRRIGAIVVHPTDSRRLWLAAMGHSYSRSEHRGVYYSKDGGQNWQKQLYVNDTTSATDLVMDAQNPDILYVSMWDNLRTPWYLGSGGPGSAIYKSTDGGKTWRKLGKGLPKLMGKIGVTVSPADSQRLYAVIEAKLEEGGLYISRNGGESWSFVNGASYLWGRPWYYMHVHADPKNPDRVYVLSTEFYRSEDAGRSFTEIPTPHGDNHALWINPNDTSILVSGNDGGATVSLNDGGGWSTVLNQRTGQFQRLAVDRQTPYTIFAGQQDGGTIAIRGRYDFGGPAGAFGFTVGGGEAGHISVDLKDQNIIYAGTELGYISRFDRRTGIETPITPYPLFPEGINPRELKYRFQVHAPIQASRHQADRVYHAANVVFRSDDRGQNWTVISPDLTRNEPDKQGAGGGPFTNERIDSHNTISTFDESPLDAEVLWVGTDDGRLQVTRDGGRKWQDVTPRGVTSGEFSNVFASPSLPGGAYASLVRYRFGDFKPYLFKTSDYGQTWTKVSDGLPQDIHARVLIEDPQVSKLLYAGTEQGVFVSFDTGQQWRELSATLPTTAITGIAVAGNDNDLLISTEGSGLWGLYGLSTLRQAGAVTPSETQLFKPNTAYLTEGAIGTGLQATYGATPSFAAATIDLFLSQTDLVNKPAIEIHITGPAGQVIRKLTLENENSPQAGFHRLGWGLERDPIQPTIAGALDGELPGSRVPPGEYEIRLKIGSKVLKQPLSVQRNPLLPTPSAAAVSQKQEQLKRLETLFSDLTTTVNAAARTAALQQWELSILDRRLVHSQRRIDYGGGFIYDVISLHGYIDRTETPIGAAMISEVDALVARWQTLKSKKP